MSDTIELRYFITCFIKKDNVIEKKTFVIFVPINTSLLSVIEAKYPKHTIEEVTHVREMESHEYLGDVV